MSDSNNAKLILVMLVLIATGFVAFFNLGANITPALDVGFGNWNGTIDMFLILLVRIIVAPALIIIPAWVIYNVIRELM